MNRILFALFAVVVVLELSSCKLYRSVTRKIATHKAADSSLIVAGGDTTVLYADTGTLAADSAFFNKIPSEKSDTATVNAINDWLPAWSAQTGFSSFSAKVKVHYESPDETQDFSANLRLEKDQKIWISITALGMFEAGRALVTPDSVYIIDRVHKEVRVVPMWEAAYFLPFAGNFETLQNFLMGNIMYQEQIPYKIVDSADRIIMQAAFVNGLQEASISKNDSSLLQQSVSGDISDFQAQYSDYFVFQERKFSKNREIKIRNGSNHYLLTMEFNNIRFDEPLDMSFSIPEKYERK